MVLGRLRVPAGSAGKNQIVVYREMIVTRKTKQPFGCPAWVLDSTPKARTRGIT